MKKALVLGLTLGVLFAPPWMEALAGERVVCSLTMPTDGGTISTADELTVVGCAASKLQSDGGIALWDGGGNWLADGGPAGCVACPLGGTKSLALQCNNPVYYSEKWDGGTNPYGQKGAVPATSSDILIDFDTNPDPYRIDLRGQSMHISVMSTSTTANTCRVGTIQRNVP